MTEADNYTAEMANLAVRLGANVQPGQIVSVSSEPGKEPMARAIAEAAYAAGAKFVDLSVFDVYFKRARALNAERDTLSYVPPWLGERVLALGEHRAARISMSGPAAPHALDDVDPDLISLDRLPRVPEAMKVLNDASTNWTIVPCPTPAWASLVYPRLEPAAALDRLWSEIAHVTRLDEPDPVAAWESRLQQLRRVSDALNELGLDQIHLVGPGTDLTVGLLPSSTWLAAKFQTAGGIEHQPNIPTEEVFTTPDPERVEGQVTSTKPLFTSGTTVTGLKVRFEGGCAVEVDAEQGAEVIRRRGRGPARRAGPGGPRRAHRAAGDRVLRHAARRKRGQPHRPGARLYRVPGRPRRPRARPPQRHPHRLHDRQQRGRCHRGAGQRRRGPVAARREMAGLAPAGGAQKRWKPARLARTTLR
jgi:aminopeptidase